MPGTDDSAVGPPWPAAEALAWPLTAVTDVLAAGFTRAPPTRTVARHVDRTDERSCAAVARVASCVAPVVTARSRLRTCPASGVRP